MGPANFTRTFSAALPSSSTRRRTVSSLSSDFFNAMMRIDRALIEAARDAGASEWQALREVVIPLARPGIAIGSILVVAVVMGDFVTVRLMSGGQSASVGLMMVNAMSLLQYPAAAANAVVLLVVVLLMVAAMMRIVDIRKEL